MYDLKQFFCQNESIHLSRQDHDDFAAYLIEQNIKINRIILFGSVVTNQFDKESDIDIFIETNGHNVQANTSYLALAGLFCTATTYKVLQSM